MHKVLKLVAIASAITVAAPLSAKDKAPALSPLALQSMQTHEFEGTKEQTFASVMSVLQDAGYRIQSGDVQTGLITGIGSTQAKTTYNIWWGLGKSKKTPIVSAYIEQIGQQSRVRLNFVMAKMKSNLYGSQPQDEEPIIEAPVYRDAFEKIEQALFIRKSMDAPKAAPTPAAPATPGPATAAPAT